MFPFQEQEFSGIGEQMSWLKVEIETYAGSSVGQSELGEFDQRSVSEPPSSSG